MNLLALLVFGILGAVALKLIKLQYDTTLWILSFLLMNLKTFYNPILQIKIL